MRKNWMNKNWLGQQWWLLGLVLTFPGCQTEKRETPTKGFVTVVVSESVSPLIEQEQKMFQELYPQAHVNLQIATAREAIARLFNDSITMIISSRPLNAEERDVIKRTNLNVHEFKIAIDGVALIVNDENPISQLRTTQLDSIFSGSVTSWRNVDKKLPNESIELCLPDRNSGTFEIVAMKILNGGTMTTPAKVAGSSQEMIDFVHEHRNAVGVVGVNWLGVDNNKEKVKTIPLSDPHAPDSLGTRGQYYSPHQAYLYQRFYPLTREIFVLSRADNYGVAAGFTTFLTSAAGQKIVVNNGLAPATMPVRLVELSNRSIQQ